MAAALTGLALAAPASSPVLVVAGLVVFGARLQAGLAELLVVNCTCRAASGGRRRRRPPGALLSAFERRGRRSAGHLAAAGRPIADAVETTLIEFAAAVAALQALVMVALPADVDRDASAS